MSEVDEAERWVLPPRQRPGAFLAFEFAGIHYRLPEMLETIAEWLRHCAEYMLEQLTVSTEDGWSKVSVIVQELRPSDIVEQLTADGHAELATSIAALVKMHGVREGLRNAGIAYS
jgi:hypothetical protein